MTDDIVRRPSRGSRPGGRTHDLARTSRGNDSSGQHATPRQPPGVDPHRYASEQGEARDTALRLRSCLDDVLASLPHLKRKLSDSSGVRVKGLRDAAVAETHRLTEAAATRAARDHDGASEALVNILGRVAPGAAGAAPDLLGTEGAESALDAHPTHVLLGFLPVTGGQDAPVVVPFWDRCGWYVQGSSKETADLALSIAVRSVALFPAKHLGVHVFDARMSGAFGSLAPIRTSAPESFPAPSADPSAFADRLSVVVEQANRNAEAIAVAGRDDLGELWSSVDLPEGRRELIIVLGYPFGVDERVQAHLLRLAAAGSCSGVNLVICEGEGAAPAREVEPTDLRRALMGVRLSPEAIEVDGYPGGIRPVSPVTPEVVGRVVKQSVAAASGMTGPSIPLTRLLDEDLRNPWAHDSATGLEVVIGESKRQPLGLSLRTQNPPHPNLLVGGAVGQGKSNLLLDLIYSLAVRYSPEQLEMHLLDFKQGLEFARFAADLDGEGWLPHVKVLSLESDLAFGVAVLRSVEAELDRRATLFKHAAVSSIDDYRAAGHSLPRLLLIVDEFHVLFEGDDELVERAVEVTSRLAKQGRAYGVHLVFASQTISGIRSLATRGDAIFAQFPLRMSLKNTAAESQAILAQGNKAAADLTYRGEVVVNRNYGGDPEGFNIQGIAAYAEPEAMAEVQRSLWQRAHADPPMMFVGTAFASWDEAFDAPHVVEGTGLGSLSVVVGRPISVSDRPHRIALAPDADQGIAVVGRDDELTAATTAALVLSAIPALAAENGGIVVLACASSTPRWLLHAQSVAASQGVRFKVVARDGVAAYLRDELGPRLASRRHSGSTLVVGLDLQRARDMELRHSEDPKDDGGPGSKGIAEQDIMWSGSFQDEVLNARDILREAYRSGAMSGVFAIANWSTLRTMELDLGPGYQGVSHVLTTGLGGDDFKVVAGVSSRPPQGFPRVGCYDQAEGVFTTLVPYDIAIRTSEEES